MHIDQGEVEVSEEQVLYFRAVRGQLADPGASSAKAAARAVIGAQAQQPGPAKLALSMRTKSRPRASTLQTMLDTRTLVRTWGQRETLHIYEPADWPLISAARALWAPGGRRGPMPTPKTLDKALEVIEDLGAATRADLKGVAPKSFQNAMRTELSKYIKNEKEAERFIAGRLIWCLSMRGDVCIAGKLGNQQSYAARTVWLPDLDWPALDPHTAATRLARRYLQFNGPATAKDVAHFFGARQREAHTWVKALREAGELRDVSCGGRKGLVILARDVASLSAKRKRTKASWPLRLLPQWDTHLMGHADKTWTVPDKSEHKLVWRSQAVVAAAVLAQGRVVAEWHREVKRKQLHVKVIPLSGWSSGKHLAGVRREAKAVAAHLGLSLHSPLEVA